ncbi:hypothetical protein APA_1347 [Pseudanabaena sp. lw0831]|uniref:hypothetical protein n=1 Tax=Pseudanabaena sp. lw0831 TaxID=1357935 RepID=UPI001A206A5A|nr:hypothetical protein [Pseudanabaena sp. lw0831]GBO53440.1 hypothetical protein APA_1347 [Pseudanabaena sp. lw0831]
MKGRSFWQGVRSLLLDTSDRRLRKLKTAIICKKGNAITSISKEIHNFGKKGDHFFSILAIADCENWKMRSSVKQEMRSLSLHHFLQIEPPDRDSHPLPASPQFPLELNDKRSIL